MKRLVIEVTAVLALVAALVGGWRWSERLIGAAQAKEAAAIARADSLARVAKAIDTVYVVLRDTVRVRIAKLDTMTVTVEQWKHDTVQVVEYVTRADSAVRACSALVRTCDEERGILRGEIASLRTARAEHERTHPSRAKRMLEDLGKVGLGALLHAVLGPR